MNAWLNSAVIAALLNLLTELVRYVSAHGVPW